METITFHAASLPGEDLAAILADYLALEEARVFRRLFVTRFGLLALAVFLAARIIPGFSTYAHWVPVALCLVPPVWARGCGDQDRAAAVRKPRGRRA
jgi:hypothetical protein